MIEKNKDWTENENIQNLLFCLFVYRLENYEKTGGKP
jgi:hypothetical protein